MTLMLASVASPAEAEAVWAGGADIIDLKESGEGRARRARCHCRGRHCSLGRQTPAGERRRGQPGLRQGLSSTRSPRWPLQERITSKLASRRTELEPIACAALAPHAKTTKLVGVLFADCAPDFDLLGLMASNGFTGAMLDTAKKGAGRLLDHMDIAALDGFIGHCRENRLMAGLAGSLEAPDVPRLLPLEPDYSDFAAACAMAACARAKSILHRSE